MAISEEILRAFHRRFYDWVQRQWDEEITSRLGRLSRIHSVEAESFLAILRTLSVQDLRSLAVALNKSRPMGPRALVGDLVGGIAPEEEQRIRLFRDAAWRLSSAKQLTGHGGAWTSARAARAALRACIQERLKATAGIYEEFGGKNEWRYLKSIGSWRVYTHIDVSDRQQQLICEHYVRWGEDHSLIESVSLMSWLGLVGSTRWNTLRTGREAEAAETVAILCDEFLSALPALLDGL